ncbi:MAG: hypothetical protein LBR55_00460, partial [Bacteroidales bacterium]|nr:hypothetical protein [Bacteroidales bacterium]
MKRLSQIGKFALKTVAILLGVLALCYVLSLLPVVQKYTTRFAAQQLSRVIGLNVSVESIRITSYNTIGLYDVSVTNAANDTIVQAEKAGAQLVLVDFKSLQIELNAISLQKATIRAVKGTDSLWNFNNLLTTLFTDTVSSGWKVAIDEIDIENSKLVLIDNTVPKNTAYGIDFNNLAIENFQCRIDSLHMIDNGIEFSLSTLAGTEQSGFELQQLQTQVHIDNKTIDLQNVDLQTNNSQLQLK